MTETGGDSRDLSALGGELRKLADGTPEREAYLDKLAAEIRAGRYRVDSEELARKLFADLQKESRSQK
jgi:anti-sigma28 factor (negative regulator of flagellin synthesis)